MNIAHAVFAPAFWWMTLRATTVYEIGELTFADGQRDGDTAADICRLIELALGEIESVGPEYVSMVKRNLRGIVRSVYTGPTSFRHLRIYMSPFSKTECSDPRLLATRLVMSARYFEVSNAGNVWTRRVNEEQARWYARQTQDWFIRQLPDWKSWLDGVRGNWYR